MASGRRTSLASLAGARVETVPGQNEPILVRLAPDKAVPTPLNPRTNFGTADSLVELGESMRKRQLQPVVVVSRASYLKLFPEHADVVGAASYVIANGERRYRAARQVDLPALEAIIREEVAATRGDFLDAVLSENIDRKNFDPIEEALAVQAMVKECGTAVAAAAKFRRSGGWVSQRLALLRLAPEVQVKVRAGEIPVRDARELATHPQDEQMRLWQRRVQERADQRETRARASTPDTAPATPELSGPPPAATPAPAVVGVRAGSAPVQDDQAGAARPRNAVPEQAAPGQGAPGPAPVVTSAPMPVPAVEREDPPIAAARDLVARFTEAERRRIVVFLMDAEAEAEAARTAGAAAV